MGVSLKGKTENRASDSSCVFCNVQLSDRQEIVAENGSFAVIYDKYPVNPGHCLLFPRRHVESLFELRPREWVDLRRLLVVARNAINERFHPEGFNIGIN